MMFSVSRCAACTMLFLAFFAAMITCPSTGHANVTITPTAVLIEGRDRYADVTLINSGGEPNTYEMKWQFFRMIEGTGAYEDADGSLTEFDLSKHIVFTPKRITIAPGGMQKIRMALRLNGTTPPPGDYRAHFLFKEVAPVAPDITKPASKPRVGIRINVGFSIPVVYRVGESDAGAKIGTVEVRNNPRNGRLEAVIPVTRTGGAYGTMGNLSIRYKPDGGEETQVGEVTNANIFPEITHTKFTVPLTAKTLGGGQLHVVYQDKDLKKGIIFDQKTVPIQ